MERWFGARWIPTVASFAGSRVLNGCASWRWPAGETGDSSRCRSADEASTADEADVSAGGGS